MKKILCFIFALALLLVGCGSKQTPTEVTQPAASETATEAVTEAATEAPTEAPAAEIPETTEAAAPAEEAAAPAFRFTTTDLAGETVTEAIFTGYDLIIINEWEPWCGPCVGEMPALERIHQEHGDRVLILGAFFTEDGVEEVLRETGVTYPVIHNCPEFAPFSTDYVPTTVALDGQGNLLYGPEVGAMPYENWKALVEELLP